MKLPDRTSGLPLAPASAVAFGPLPATARPDRKLLHYYLLGSLLLGPFFFFAFVPLLFRFRSMRYEVDDEGISMRWGVLFRREISLTYSRIQDIHLSSNVVERWLGLGKVQVQTASGSASAEMTIQGLPNHEEVRDFLYARMRGSRRSGALSGADGNAGDEALAATLQEVAREVRAIRQALSEAATDG